jgi:hypothetical protein
MLRTLLTCAVLCLILVARTWADDPSAEPDPKPSGRNWVLAPSVSVYLPDDRQTRDLFGDQWAGIGIAVLPGKEKIRRNAVKFDLALVSAKAGENYAYLLPLGVSYEHRIPMGDAVATTLGAGADFVVSDVRIDQANIPAKLRTSGGWCLYSRTQLGNRVELRVRYNGLEPVRGYDFSGTAVSLLVRL